MHRASEPSLIEHCVSLHKFTFLNWALNWVDHRSKANLANDSLYLSGHFRDETCKCCKIDANKLDRLALAQSVNCQVCVMCVGHANNYKWKISEICLMIVSCVHQLCASHSVDDNDHIVRCCLWSSNLWIWHILILFESVPSTLTTKFCSFSSHCFDQQEKTVFGGTEAFLMVVRKNVKKSSSRKWDN